jgi:hypothetical protein
MSLKLLPDVFEKAADAVKDRGHTKGVYMNSNGCVCALGALGVALGVEFKKSTSGLFYGAEPEDSLNPEFTDEYMWYGGYLNDFLEDYEHRNGWSSVPGFNDDEDTKPEDVEKFLRAAAQDLREEYSRAYNA